MALYDEMQGIAREILSDPDFNQGVIQLVKVTPGAGPVDEPGPSVEVVHTLEGAVARGVQFKYVQKGLAAASDEQVTHSIVPGVPIGQPEDFILIDQRRLKIVQRVLKPSAGTPVVATYIVR